MATCRTCGANWSEGKFTRACLECGGGGMTIPCPACNGDCGSTWQRAVIDSNDSGSATFMAAVCYNRSRQNVNSGVNHLRLNIVMKNL